MRIELYLGQVGEDVEAGLGDGDVHGVFGTDVDGSSRFRNINEVITRHRAFILERVVLHLHHGNEWNKLNLSRIDPEAHQTIVIQN